MSSFQPSDNHPRPGVPPAPPPPPPRRSGVPAPPPPPRRSGVPAPPAYIKQMVEQAHALEASEIHIRVGDIPQFRIQDEMCVAEGHDPVTPEIFETYLSEILSPAQREQFAETKELETVIFFPGFLRCQVKCFDSLNGRAIILSWISREIPSIDGLGLPPVLKDIVSKWKGLIFVTGPTGSGKSTTIAAMIRHLNETASKHISTIEDPIKYVHPSQNCLIRQREVGLQAQDFSQMLKAALREDPDLFIIGEMRDRDTINTAFKAAQCGLLVLGTLHTHNALDAVNTLLNFYNPDEQALMRVAIAESLVAVIAQQLVPTTDNHRIAVHDILINTPAMQDYLLKGNEDEAFRLMESATLEGMQVMNQALYKQLLADRITIETALTASPDPSALERMLQKQEL